MKLTENKLRKIIREEVIQEARSAEYADEGFRAYDNGNREKFIDEITNLLHAAASLAMSDPETKRYHRKIQEMMYNIDELR